MNPRCGVRRVQVLTEATKISGDLRSAREHAVAADARTLLESTTVPIFRDIGDRWGLAFALCALGDALVTECRLDEASAAYDEALGISHALNDRYGIGSSYARSAVLAAARGDAERTASFSGPADELFREIGGALGPSGVEHLTRL